MKPMLETPRLTLIPFDESDVDLLYNTLTDPYVRRYLMDNEIIPYDKAKEFILINEQHFEKDNWGLWKLILKADGEFAGVAGLWMSIEENQPQLLFALLPDKTKKGYALEASKAVIAYAFDNLQFKYLNAACDTPNKESRTVCEKLNMKEVEEKEINGNKTTFYRLDNLNHDRL